MKYLVFTDKWIEKIVIISRPFTQQHAWGVAGFLAAQCKWGSVHSVSKFM